MFVRIEHRNPPISPGLKYLRDLVRQGEGLLLEFKLKTNHPEKIVREVVAFANTQGGKLLVGIADDKSIKGLKYADEDEYLLVKEIEKKCYPPLDYQIERIPIENGLEVLVFSIAKSPRKPHYVCLDDDQTNRKAYVRVADKSVQASKEMREILKGERLERNIRFQYGDKERLLMQYLEEKPHITVNAFVALAQITRKVASQTLIRLTLANVLRILPNETEDYFVRKP